MDRDKVTELLKNYRSYKYAISNGIAPYQAEDTVGMPMGGGYGSRPPAGLNGRGTILDSLMDYQKYKRAITCLEGAIEDVLDDDEREVIRMKYLERNKLTLDTIAKRKHMHKNTVTGIHKRALKTLANALMFVEVPQIHNLDGMVNMDKCDFLVSSM
jgi:predicted DNA-binding protein (UPF0251 family)